MSRKHPLEAVMTRTGPLYLEHLHQSLRFLGCDSWSSNFHAQLAILFRATSPRLGAPNAFGGQSNLYVTKISPKFGRDISILQKLEGTTCPHWVETYPKLH